MIVNAMIDQWLVGAGAAGMVFIFIYCCWSVWDESVKDGFIGRFLYCMTAFGSVAWLLHIRDEVFPVKTTMTLVICFAILLVRRAYLKSAMYARIRCWWFTMAKEARAKNYARQK